MGIAILLVHHVRKKEDDDPFNMPSGSNGLAGCADTLFVLKKSKRCSEDATLFCTGRDIEYREIDVRFEKETCTWSFISDSAENPETLLPRPMQKLVEMMKDKSAFSGSNADFMEEFKSYSGIEIHTNVMKKMMKKHRSELEENGVTFEDCKRNNDRCIDICYDPPADNR